MMVAGVVVVNPALQVVIGVVALTCRCHGVGRGEHGVCRHVSPATAPATPEAGTTAVPQDLLLKAEAGAMPSETDLHLLLWNNANHWVADAYGFNGGCCSPTTYYHTMPTKHYRNFLDEWKKHD